MPRPIIYGRITGLALPEQTGRGRPQVYVNADARKLHARLAEIEKLVAKLAVDVGFTPVMSNRLRSDLMAAANGLNRNIHPAAVAKRKADARKGVATRAAKRAAAKRNPVDHTHAMLMHGPNGARLTVCGFKPPARVRDGVWCCSVHITECAELVDCPACLDAGGPSAPM